MTAALKKIRLQLSVICVEGSLIVLRNSVLMVLLRWTVSVIVII